MPDIEWTTRSKERKKIIRVCLAMIMKIVSPVENIIFVLFGNCNCYLNLVFFVFFQKKEKCLFLRT